LEPKSMELNAPYLKLLSTATPWVVAKWAMSLDGAIATHDQDSKWISNEASRAVVHRIRSRMDAIIVGIGTALADDPLLTTRLTSGASPARVASRVVLDRNCRLSLSSQLVQSVSSAPLIVATSEQADSGRVRSLAQVGCEMLLIPETMLSQSFAYLLAELGKRRFTNVLLEGGGTLLGHAFDEGLVDQVHCFIAPKIVGGAMAVRPVGGSGRSLIRHAMQLERVTVEKLGDNVHIQGRSERSISRRH
jgi:diaminohydroxyphosphoribosylaminopyrimidine deaminase / 5-amino-6-(5-phosphoribosylamino)uracil reductase